MEVGYFGCVVYVGEYVLICCVWEFGCGVFLGFVLIKGWCYCWGGLGYRGCWNMESIVS